MFIFLSLTMMLNYFCCMVDQRIAKTIVRDPRHREPPLQHSVQAGFYTAQNLCSHFKLRCAVVPTTIE